MKLEDLGYTPGLENARIEQGLNDFEVGRVTSEHKERYIIRTISGESEAEITGNLRYTAKGREDFPAVGDWVALTTYEAGIAIIHQVLPRYSVIKRQAVGQFGEIQIIAANIDYAFIVQALDRDFNVNRLERYLTICHSSDVGPILLLTKTDLINEERIAEFVTRARSRIPEIPILAVSNETLTGYDELKALIRKGKTYCILGSSGVGKSTLLNNLSGSNIMRTDAISLSSNKGRHVTSHRELIILGNGGMLIDTPGMRELGIADSGAGLEMTFELIARISETCRFRDCTHTQEAGCAILEAVAQGEIDTDSYENYLKMQRENAHFESTVAEKRKKDKAFGKFLKNYKKDMGNRS